MPGEIELLAPAGRWEALESVVDAGADAVYLGGKRFNMRLLRPDFNFTDEEIRKAVVYCHQRGVKLYVTVNNLYYESELDSLADYLKDLENAGVDALIIQDLGLINLTRELGINLPLHASVQMGVNNLETAQLLEASGVCRVILSKNLSLPEIEQIHSGCGLALEFFVHGDLCIAHTGQCYLSGLLTGRCGNRGECRKPCRWRYRVEGPGDCSSDYKYYLAHKDLCLYPHLDKLIEAGVSSFKIEGRMRDKDYLGFLVSTYRRALDRLAADEKPVDDSDWQELHRRRIRDLCPGSLFGREEVDCVGLSGEREPYFPTAPVQLKPLEKSDIEPATLREYPLPALTVHVGSRAALEVAVAHGAENIMISGTIYNGRPGGFGSLKEVKEALVTVEKAGLQAVLEMPRIVTVYDRQAANRLLDLAAGMGTVVAANDPGTMLKAVQMDLPVWAGPGLNVFNSEALEQVKTWGAVRVCVPAELQWKHLLEMMNNASLPLDIQVQGRMLGLVSDYCVPKAVNQRDNGTCSGYCRTGSYVLVDELGQKYALETDDNCRCYIYHPMELSWFERLGTLPLRAGDSLRLEAEHYTPALLDEVLTLYKKALDKLQQGQAVSEGDWTRMLELFPGGLTGGPEID